MMFALTGKRRNSNEKTYKKRATSFIYTLENLQKICYTVISRYKQAKT